VISLEVGSLTPEGDCSALGLSDGEADGVHHALRHPLVPTNKKTPSIMANERTGHFMT
jgi:hypothetical protein